MILIHGHFSVKSLLRNRGHFIVVEGRIGEMELLLVNMNSYALNASGTGTLQINSVFLLYVEACDITISTY